MPDPATLPAIAPSAAEPAASRRRTTTSSGWAASTAPPASRLVEAAWDDKLEAADGDLLASAILSPDSFAAAEAAILDATYGPRGLVVRAATIEAQSFCFVGVVEIYRAADELRHAAIETLSYGLGYVIGVNLPAVLLAGGVALRRRCGWAA